MIKFMWKSPLCQIESVDIRISKVTQNRYAVVRVKACVAFTPLQKELRERYGNQTTLLCFKESLLLAFFPGSINYFEGEVEFNWGNTYLKITKFFTDTGCRILKPDEDGDACWEAPLNREESNVGEDKERERRMNERRTKGEEEDEGNPEYPPEGFSVISSLPY